MKLIVQTDIKVITKRLQTNLINVSAKSLTILLSGKPKQTHSRIDEQVYFLDGESLWEHFYFRSIKSSNRLATLNKNEFQWNPNHSRDFFERRGNFQGITLFGITELWTTYNYMTNLYKQEEHVSQTVPNTHEVRCIFRHIFKNNPKICDILQQIRLQGPFYDRKYTTYFW